jgi:hypothetical protein
MRQHVVTLFNVEKRFIKNIEELDQAVDSALSDRDEVPLSELEKASRDFVAMGDDLDKYGKAVNVFFAVFDRLVRESSGGKYGRESALILKITPPGSGADQEVTKYFMA